MASIYSRCPCCDKATHLEAHHLIPQSVFSIKPLCPKEKYNYRRHTLHVCRDCHIIIHWAANNQELAERFNKRNFVIELVRSKREAFALRKKDREKPAERDVDPEVVDKYYNEFMMELA